MRTMMRARQTHKRKFLALFFIFFFAQKSFKQQKRNQWILKFCVVVHWFVLCFFDLALLSVDLFIFPYLPKNSFPVHCPQAICTLLSPCIRRCCFRWVFISLVACTINWTWRYDSYFCTFSYFCRFFHNVFLSIVIISRRIFLVSFFLFLIEISNSAIKKSTECKLAKNLSRAQRKTRTWQILICRN